MGAEAAEERELAYVISAKPREGPDMGWLSVKGARLDRLAGEDGWSVVATNP